MFLGIFIILVGLSSSPWKELTAWAHGGSASHALFLFPAFLSLLFCGLGLLLLVAAVLGIPRLVIDSTGVTHQTPFGTMSARWGSLAPFALTVKARGRNKGKAYAASSSIIGKDVSKNLAKAKYFKLVDSYTDNLENIVAALNHHRSIALADAPADVLNPRVEHVPEVDSLSQIGDPRIGTPWVTLAIMLVLTLVYGVEVVLTIKTGGGGVPNRGVLMALGALNHDAVMTMHEWYRVFTAVVLHASFSHLFLNSIALFFAGLVVERLYGRLWFFAFFVLGGIGGSFMSLAVNPESIFSVGASGAIMALFSALLVGSFRMPKGGARVRVQAETLRILLPALFPTASAAGHRIDVGAHFGGFLVGLVVAMVLLKMWSHQSVSPPGKSFAKFVSVAGVAATILSLAWVVPNLQNMCATGDDPNKTIKACTAVIQADKEGAKQLAVSLVYRGMAYGDLKQNDLALADLNRAVQVDENFMTLSGRGALFTLLLRYNDAIADYSRAINMMKDDHLMASLLGLRAAAYIGNGQNDEAEEDIDRALRINPSNPTALNMRANIYMQQGDYDKAIDTLSRGISSSSSADLYWSRGIAKVYRMGAMAAIDDLRAGLKLEPANGYKVLWLHIAHAKVKDDDRQWFEQNSSKLVPGKWPQPLVDVYLTKLSIDGGIAKASIGDAAAQRAQICEANFYIGELYVLRGEKAEAKRLMQAAVDNCPLEYVERSAARTELKNMRD